MAFLPCKNPNCRSHGQAHPNCRCYDNLSGDQIAALGEKGYELPGTTKGMTLQGTRGGSARNARSRGRRVIFAANGGEIKHFCEMEISHRPDCEYYAEGGPIGTPEPPPQPVNPNITLHHAAIQHGLLGILNDVGGLTLHHPEEHRKTLEKAREHLLQGNHEKAIDSLQGSPLTGRAPRGKVEPMIHRLGPEIINKELDPGSFRAATDYLHSSMKGNDALENHLGSFFDKQRASEKLKPNEDDRKKLDEMLRWTQESPQALLDVGGSLGHYLPDHAAAVGSLAATAVDYLNTLRPKTKQSNPLDVPIPPDESAVEQFNRQVDIAQNPLLILQHIRNGSLLPTDLKTLGTLYPALQKSMQDKAAEALINAKSKGKEIPYEQRASLGMLLGQPLDSSMTIQGMQAIIQANGQHEQPEQQMPQKKKSSGKPTAAQLKQIDKVDRMYETPIESRQLDRKS